MPQHFLDKREQQILYKFSVSTVMMEYSDLRGRNIEQHGGCFWLESGSNHTSSHWTVVAVETPSSWLESILQESRPFHLGQTSWQPTQKKIIII